MSSIIKNIPILSMFVPPSMPKIPEPASIPGPVAPTPPPPPAAPIGDQPNRAPLITDIQGGDSPTQKARKASGKLRSQGRGQKQTLLTGVLGSPGASSPGQSFTTLLGG